MPCFALCLEPRSVNLCCKFKSYACYLCLQEGNADAGRYQLETAISTYRNQTGLLGSDAVLAGYHLKLGRCVNMGAKCYW